MLSTDKSCKILPKHNGFTFIRIFCSEWTDFYTINDQKNCCYPSCKTLPRIKISASTVLFSTPNIIMFLCFYQNLKYLKTGWNTKYIYIFSDFQLGNTWIKCLNIFFCIFFHNSSAFFYFTFCHKTLPCFSDFCIKT